MREEDRQNTLHAHHPPTQNVQKAVQVIATAAPPEAEAVEAEKEASDDSDEVPAVNTDMRLENSDDEDNHGGRPDTVTSRSATKAMVKGRGALRNEINAAQQGEEEAHETDGHKRKASNVVHTAQTPASKKSKNRNSSLRADWDSLQDGVSAAMDSTPLRRSASAGSAMSITSTVSTSQKRPVAVAPKALQTAVDSDGEEIGGILSDEDGNVEECKKLKADVKAEVRYRGGVVGAKVASLQKEEAHRWRPARQGRDRLSHLSNTVQSGWDPLFKPRVIEYLGMLKPWVAFSDGDEDVICGIWAEVFPSEGELEPQSQRRMIVDGIVTSWQHKFSLMAARFITTQIFSEFEDTREARAAWAVWALMRDLSEEELQVSPEKTHCFYYCVYEEPEEPDGKFVIMCRHHISQWETGSLIKPAGLLSNFLAANWGDRQDRLSASQLIDADLISEVMDVVKKLSVGHWDRISKAVRAYNARQMKVSAKPLDTTTKTYTPCIFDIIDQDDD
ncbi:hypothetical protein H0H92_001074 [Tricholoma furcatifolium]|nr:hypothetical protein H0H92_001074 [Tricholoma furcatifolium]